LKDLGGKWNGTLKGWIFSLKVKPNVEEFLTRQGAGPIGPQIGPVKETKLGRPLASPPIPIPKKKLEEDGGKKTALTRKEKATLLKKVSVPKIESVDLDKIYEKNPDDFLFQKGDPTCEGEITFFDFIRPSIVVGMKTWQFMPLIVKRPSLGMIGKIQIEDKGVLTGQISRVYESEKFPSFLDAFDLTVDDPEQVYHIVIENGEWQAFMFEHEHKIII